MHTDKAMKHRQLGNSGLFVSELALGTMIFGEESERGTPSHEAERMTDYYLDSGGNHIDLADVYAGGRAEEIIGRVIKDRRDQVVLTTKVRWPMGSGVNDVGLSRYHIQLGVEASLRRLNVETIDLLYLHGWDPLTPLEESLRTCDDLVRAGKVRYIGVSTFKAWQMMKALGISDKQGWVRFIAAQYQYSLVVRDIESEFIDLCQVEGLGLVAWGPLGGGFLSGKYQMNQRPQSASDGRLAVTPDTSEEAWLRRATDHNWRVLDAVSTMAKNHPGSTTSQIALAWLLTRPAVASVIVGARTLNQLKDNLLAADLRLDEDEIDRLNTASDIAAAYPYRMINTTVR
jgi:aryl-alcohol dehydrogenase-like predicted oxidoreductase